MILSSTERGNGHIRSSGYYYECPVEHQIDHHSFIEQNAYKRILVNALRFINEFRWCLLARMFVNNKDLSSLVWLTWMYVLWLWRDGWHVNV